MSVVVDPVVVLSSTFGAHDVRKIIKSMDRNTIILFILLLLPIQCNILIVHPNHTVAEIYSCAFKIGNIDFCSAQCRCIYLCQRSWNIDIRQTFITKKSLFFNSANGFGENNFFRIGTLEKQPAEIFLSFVFERSRVLSFLQS